MEQKQLKGLLAVAGLSILIACGGGSGGIATETTSAELLSGCLSTLTGGGTTVTASDSGCPNCSVSDAANSIDTSNQTFSGLNFDVAGGQLSLSAKAQEGVVFPAGNYAGVYVFFPKIDGSGYSSISVNIKTYLEGNVQQTVYTDTTNIGNLLDSGSDAFFGDTTSAPFDQVEIEVNASGAESTIRVYDFCADN
ncbi:MAG: hypothetical protein OXT49_07790 [Gammaproteobacteria bacterium]|nr:hypothetical protein [Gammaproteobacteria bacterium]